MALEHKELPKKGRLFQTEDQSKLGGMDWATERQSHHLKNYLAKVEKQITDQKMLIDELMKQTRSAHTERASLDGREGAEQQEVIDAIDKILASKKLEDAAIKKLAHLKGDTYSGQAIKEILKVWNFMKDLGSLGVQGLQKAWGQVVYAALGLIRSFAYIVNTIAVAARNCFFVTLSGLHRLGTAIKYNIDSFRIGMSHDSRIKEKEEEILKLKVKAATMKTGEYADEINRSEMELEAARNGKINALAEAKTEYLLNRADFHERWDPMLKDALTFVFGSDRVNANREIEKRLNQVVADQSQVVAENIKELETAIPVLPEGASEEEQLAATAVRAVADTGEALAIIDPDDVDTILPSETQVIVHNSGVHVHPQVFNNFIKSLGSDSPIKLADPQGSFITIPHSVMREFGFNLNALTAVAAVPQTMKLALEDQRPEHGNEHLPLLGRS